MTTANHITIVKALRTKIANSNGPTAMTDQEWNSLTFLNDNGLNTVANLSQVQPGLTYAFNIYIMTLPQYIQIKNLVGSEINELEYIDHIVEQEGFTYFSIMHYLYE